MTLPREDYENELLAAELDLSDDFAEPVAIGECCDRAYEKPKAIRAS